MTHRAMAIRDARGRLVLVHSRPRSVQCRFDNIWAARNWAGTELGGRFVSGGMRTGLIALALAVFIAGCGGDTGNGGDSAASETPEMMAAALVELVTVNHGFGEGPPPFTEYLIQNRIDLSAGSPEASTDESVRLLTDSEREAIEAAISEYGSVRWIDDPAEWSTPDLTPTIEGAAILGVGEPVIETDTGLVPVSMWCGGACGTWLTYRLDLINDTWLVTDIEGPIAVS